MHLRRTLGIIVILGTLAGVVPTHATAKPDPRAVNLTLHDLPTGFTLKSNVTRNNAQAIKAGDTETLAQENARGRVLSSDTVFESAGLMGLLQVESTVIEFRNATYATEAVKSAGTALATLKAFKQMSVGPLGTNRFAALSTVKVNSSVNASVVEIGFCRGPYEVVVSGEGITNTFTPTQVYNLAKIVDKHILKHG